MQQYENQKKNIACGRLGEYIETKIAMGSSHVANGKVMCHHGKVIRGQMPSCVVTCASHLENLETSKVLS